MQPPNCVRSGSVQQHDGVGILLLGAGAGTSFKTNTVSGNDIGIYTDDGVTLSHSNANNNRYVDIFVGLWTLLTAR